MKFQRERSSGERVPTKIVKKKDYEQPPERNVLFAGFRRPIVDQPPRKALAEGSPKVPRNSDKVQSERSGMKEPGRGRFRIAAHECRPSLPQPIQLAVTEFHRRMIRMRDCKADRLVQLYLSFFSIAKFLLLVPNPKRARYPLKGIARRVEVDELLEGLGELYEEYTVPLFERYLPSYLNQAIPIGFRWRPTWSSVPNSGSGLVANMFRAKAHRREGHLDPGSRVTAYAILGDDIVIGDSEVAAMYHKVVAMAKVASTLYPSITDVDVVSLPRKTSNVLILVKFRLVERGHCPLPRYQPGLIDPAIAGETEHLVGMVFPSLGIGMGSGGPGEETGEETLDPRDGMGNGDVSEAGGLVMVGVPAFSLLLFCFPFSRARCIDTSWCPSHGVNGSGSGSSFRSHVTDAGGIGGAASRSSSADSGAAYAPPPLPPLPLCPTHPWKPTDPLPHSWIEDSNGSGGTGRVSTNSTSYPPLGSRASAYSFIGLDRGDRRLLHQRQVPGSDQMGGGYPSSLYRKENYAGSKPLPLSLLSGGHEPLIHCHFGQSRNRDRVRLQAQELINHGIEAAIVAYPARPETGTCVIRPDSGRVYAGAMAWDTLKVACLPLVTSFSLARSHCILALLDLKSTPCLAEGKRREEASDSFMHAPLGSGEYSSVGRAPLLQLGRCDYGLDV
ncbi:hypothetical protein Syun_031980 [Stephania yunnanensis]|uniref:Uncharacterized protein n=1 Tax=Stephania yunnanensis TaxID=152371 RepID=A0AAP0HF38_9MAGN